jgi:hypothetical protein
MITENWKKISEHYYISDHGYYVRKNNNWSFLPFEHEYSSSMLLDIINNLSILEDKYKNETEL